MIAAAVVVLAAAQLLLPAVAARGVRTQLARDGTVLDVRVRAFPGLQLLWGRSRSLDISLADYRLTPAALGAFLREGGDVTTLRVQIGMLTAGRLKLRQVSLVKRGSALDGEALIATADLQAALPVMESVEAVSGPAGPLILRGTASAFGMRASATAVVIVRDGNVLVIPQGLLSVLGPITVFDQPGIRVRSLTGSATPDGVSITASAELG